MLMPGFRMEAAVRGDSGPPDFAIAGGPGGCSKEARPRPVTSAGQTQ